MRKVEVYKLGESRGIAIEKPCDSNFHVWKCKTILILTYREVDDNTSLRNTHKEGTDECVKWIQCDKLDRSFIGLSQSDDMLEYVRDVTSPKQM